MKVRQVVTIEALAGRYPVNTAANFVLGFFPGQKHHRRWLYHGA
jgi:hypothetical protein